MKDEFNINDIIGKTTQLAKELLEDNSYKIRIVKENGKDLRRILNAVPNRVNVAAENDIVTAVLSIG